MQYHKILLNTLIVLLLLYFGRILFIPLFFACFISFILYPICKRLEARKISRTLSIFIGLIIVCLPIAGIIAILIRQLIHISHYWPLTIEKLVLLFEKIKLPEQYKLLPAQKEEWIKLLFMNASSYLYSGFFASLIGLVQIVLIPFYAALILYNRKRLVYFIYLFIPETNAARIKSILIDTIHTYYNFVKGMLIVYLAVGILNSLGLFLLGIPNAILFGFTASILTFIPYIGIVIGSVLPVTIAWIIHENIYYPLGVIGIFTFVQFLEAYFIFPIAVSHKIKVNTLVTIIAIFVGGIVWGAAGMILFIPFLSILKLVAERVETLHPLAVLLGAGSFSKSKSKRI